MHLETLARLCYIQLIEYTIHRQRYHPSFFQSIKTFISSRFHPPRSLDLRVRRGGLNVPAFVHRRSKDHLLLEIVYTDQLCFGLLAELG